MTIQEQYQQMRSGPETVKDKRPSLVVHPGMPEVICLMNYPLAVQLYGLSNTTKILARINAERNEAKQLFINLLALKQTDDYKENFRIWGDRQAASFLRMKVTRFKDLKQRGWIRTEAHLQGQNIYRPQSIIDGLLKTIKL